MSQADLEDRPTIWDIWNGTELMKSDSRAASGQAGKVFIL